MYFVENTLRYITDDLSTRILKPTYGWDELALGDFEINWIDVSSVLLKKADLDFTGGNRDDPTWAYNHIWTIDFGTVLDTAKQTWLIELPLWKNKKIDLSQIDSVNYPIPFEIVSKDQELRWRFENGVQEALAATMTFYDKNPRTLQQLLPTDGFQLFELEPIRYYPEDRFPKRKGVLIP